MIKKWLFLSLTLLVFHHWGICQVSIRDSSINVLLVGLGYGHYLPAGDMADRFGNNSMVVGNVMFKTKSQWLYGFDGTFIFSNNVNQKDLFKNIETTKGGIIGSDGKLADVRKYERGYTITFNGGYLFSKKKPNPNSGFVAVAGVGFMQHKIRIETIGNTVPALSKEYRKGYDRLSNGLVLHQYFGYQYMGNKHLINFFAGIDIFEGFTAGRRSYNFDIMTADNSSRTDILIGLRAGWYLPLYKKAPEKIYFY